MAIWFSTFLLLLLKSANILDVFLQILPGKKVVPGYTIPPEQADQIDAANALLYKRVIIPAFEICSFNMCCYTFPLKNLRKAVLNFPLNNNRNSHKQNFGKITSVTIPPGFNKEANECKTFSSSPVQFKPAKFEKIMS